MLNSLGYKPSLITYFDIPFPESKNKDVELNDRIGKASAVMLALHYSVVMKRESSKKANLLIFKTAFVLVPTYGHEAWITIKRVRSQVQVSDKRFLRRTEEVTLFNKMHSSEIQKPV